MRELFKIVEHPSSSHQTMNDSMDRKVPTSVPFLFWFSWG